MRFPFYTADVFTDVPFTGNPLAVFPYAADIETEQMQLIAREFNISETVFVFPPRSRDHTCHLRIFTPKAELPFAGHPTVGAAIVLARAGVIAAAGEHTQVIFEEGVGPVPVIIRARNGEPSFAQLSVAKLPEFGPAPPRSTDIAAALSLKMADLATEFKPVAVSCGLPFLCVPLRDRDAVARARIDYGAWESHLSHYWAPHVYMFSFDTALAGGLVHARMFAPALSASEDPATGSAAAALAGLLAAREPRQNGTARWTIEQGIEIGRPSIMEIEADKTAGQISAVRLGGTAIVMGQGTLNVPRV